MTGVLMSQSPYGAMWFATSRVGNVPDCGICGVAIPLRGYVVCNPSRGREGILTTTVAIPLRGYVVCNAPERPSRREETPRVAIPLRGYVVCNQSLLPRLGPTFGRKVAIPLRGYVVCNPYLRKLAWTARSRSSQSPYGAMWFATQDRVLPGGALGKGVAIPLRGYVVCNRRSGAVPGVHPGAVAIPLRG